MSVKDNFYQAVKELFNKDEENQSPLAKSLQSNVDENSDDDKDTNGLRLATESDDSENIASTPLKKPEDSTSDSSTSSASTNPVSTPAMAKPTLNGTAAAAAGYNSMQSTAKPAMDKPLEAPKPATPPASSLFNAKPAATVSTTPAAVSTPSSSLFGSKPATPATSTATSAFGAKPTTADTSSTVSSLFASKPIAPIIPPTREDKPIFSASALSNAAAEIPKPKVSTDELSASLNAIINEEYRPLSGSLESTVIAHGTVIKGDIQTTSDIEINGAVIGNIESQRSVSINGQVEGNIVAESIRLSQTSITGNLSATGLVILDKDSTLIGDIKGENIIIGGKVKGNIDGKGKATLKGQSVVAGNITIAEITIEDGAKLQGFIQTTSMSASE